MNTPILVGYDGEEGQNLAIVLQENETLRAKVTQLKQEMKDRYDDDMDLLARRVMELENRVNKHWWRRD